MIKFILKVIHKGAREAGDFFLGLLFVLAETIPGGATGPVERLAFAEGLNPQAVTLVRFSVAFFILAFFCLLRHNDAILPRKNDWYKHLLNGTGLAVCYLGVNASILRIPVGLAIVLFYTCPFWVVLGDRFWGKEPLTPLRLSALALGFFGVCLATGGIGRVRFDPAGIFYALVSGMGYAVYLLNGRYGVGHEDSFRTYVQAFGWATLLCWALAKPMHALSPLFSTSAKGWGLLFYLAFVATLLCYWLVLMALKYLPAAVVSIFLMLEIATASLWAWILFREIPTLFNILGGTLVVIAVVLLTLEGFTRKSRLTVDKKEPAMR